ncbi:MAG TPA: type III polyketide synthase [Pirellulales bacterium]|jgi:predicted naringenin-chalcone synthase|nr:type III polyketide synthase [Pirellulales bacterium]
MSLAILGLGTALPPHSMSQVQAVELAQQVCCQTEDQARLLRALYRKSGVKNRYTFLPHEIALGWNSASGDDGGAPRTLTQGPSTNERMQWYADYAPPLALRASGDALERAELQARDITHLVTVSCTGFMAPGIDLQLIQRLGLPATVERVHVGFMGCHGALNGLRVARGLVAADPDARVLLCAVELCTLHFCSFWDANRSVGNAIFGDGAAALVLAASDGQGDWTVSACGSCVIPDSQDAMGWAIGDHGFEMFLSPRVPELIEKQLHPWLTAWLDRQGLALEQIRSWAIHPGGPRILTAVEQALSLDRSATEVSRQVLSECGNMSSPTVLFILERLRQTDAPRPCVALGFGPGLVAEAALVL